MAWAPDSLRLWQRLINLCRSLSLRFARDFELLFTCKFYGVAPDQNSMRENMWSEVSGWACEAKLAGVHVIDFFCDLNLWVYMWLDLFSDTSFISSISFFAWHNSSSSLPWASLLIRFIKLKLQLWCFTFSEWSMTDFSSRLWHRFCNFFFSASASSSRFIKLFRTWTQIEVVFKWITKSQASKLR